jgi:hypothetical protein
VACQQGTHRAPPSAAAAAAGGLRALQRGLSAALAKSAPGAAFCGRSVTKALFRSRSIWQRRSGESSQAKKWGPRLGPGAPEGAFQLPVSFSHRRVGSSILASLSEAGGNDPRKVPSKPLPPRSTLCANRHLKRAHASLLCTSAATTPSRLSLS